MTRRRLNKVDKFVNLVPLNLKIMSFLSTTCREAQLIKIKKENEDLRKVADEAIKKLAENQEELKKLEAAKKAQDKLQDDKRNGQNYRKVCKLYFDFVVISTILQEKRAERQNPQA